MLKSKFGPNCFRSDGKSTRFVRTKFSQSTYLHAIIIISALIFNLNCQIVHAAEVSLAWEASEGATGYKVYYGLESQDYAFMVDIGLWTQCTISGLDIGKTYYFTVTAYNEYGESDFAGEINYEPHLCDADLDNDGDIDGWELAEFISDPSMAHLSDFAAGFGRTNCDN